MGISNIPCQACGFDPSRRVTYSAEETLRFKWKSGNVVNPPGHQSRWVYRSYREGFRKAFAKVAYKFTPASGYRRVTLTRLFGNGPGGGRCRPYDTDNLLQGAKPIIDALVKDFNLLLDDDPKSCERVYLQEPSQDGKHYIKIKIEEFDVTNET